jgi:hypothetical protein
MNKVNIGGVVDIEGGVDTEDIAAEVVGRE